MTALEACSLLVDATREIAAVRAERDSYRAVAQQAIHSLHACDRERRKLQERYARLRDEYRAYRATTICDLPRRAA